MVIAITYLDGPTLAVTVGLLEPIMAGGPPFKQCCRIDYSISKMCTVHCYSGSTLIILWACLCDLLL